MGRVTAVIHTRGIFQDSGPMNTLKVTQLPEHEKADTIVVTRMTAGKDNGAREPIVDIQASSAQQDVAPSLPAFDLSEFLAARNGPLAEQNRFCEDVASCLQQTGCLIVRDPRVGTAQSDCFLDMMERYFSQSTELKMPDVHPELHYQVHFWADKISAPSCTVQL